MEFLSTLVELNTPERIILWWIKKNIEIFAVLTGFIYLIYSVLGDKRLWVFGFFSSGVFVYVCFNSGLYADMGINLYYVAISIYGWIAWSVGKKGRKKELVISKSTLRQHIIFTTATAVLFCIVSWILIAYTPSTVPFWDAFTTSASIVATYMLALKKLEHWIYWVVVDTISVWLYAYKGLYPTAFLFAVYTIIAIYGYLAWKKNYQQGLKV